jgi:hypothetical protein
MEAPTVPAPAEVAIIPAGLVSAAGVAAAAEVVVPATVTNTPSAPQANHTLEPSEVIETMLCVLVTVTLVHVGDATPTGFNVHARCMPSVL